MKKLLVAMMTLAFSLSAQARGLSTDYVIPVSNNLKAYSNFRITDLKISSSDDLLTISYKLPAELLGYEQKVEFKQYSAATELDHTITLIGRTGYLKCNADGERLTECSAQYNNRDVKVDLASVEAIWKSKKVSAEELVGRMAVVESFSGELVGVFAIPEVR